MQRWLCMCEGGYSGSVCEEQMHVRRDFTVHTTLRKENQLISGIGKDYAASQLVFLLI